MHRRCAAMSLPLFSLLVHVMSCLCRPLCHISQRAVLYPNSQDAGWPCAADTVALPSSAAVSNGGASIPVRLFTASDVCLPICHASCSVSHIFCSPPCVQAVRLMTVAPPIPAFDATKVALIPAVAISTVLETHAANPLSNHDEPIAQRSCEAPSTPTSSSVGPSTSSETGTSISSDASVIDGRYHDALSLTLA